LDNDDREEPMLQIPFPEAGIRVLANALRHAFAALVATLAFALAGGNVSAQTYGFATLPPGSLNHTTASAVAKVLKDKAGLNMLVQPTAGDQIIVPMVSRGEADVGISNAMEVHNGFKDGLKDLRIIGAAHALRVGFFVRKDSNLRSVADLKGKRVPYGFSAMRALEPTVRAILATAGLSEKDIRPVLVPNVTRSADDFVSGAADAFYFAFGAPKVREADAAVGGIRFLAVDPAPAAVAALQRVLRTAYVGRVDPAPNLPGVREPLMLAQYDVSAFVNANLPAERVRAIVRVLAEERDALALAMPAFRQMRPERMYARIEVPYHDGAIAYFRDRGISQAR